MNGFPFFRSFVLVAFPTKLTSFRLGKVHFWLRAASSGAPGARVNAIIGSLARSSLVKNLLLRRACCPTSLCPCHFRFVDSHQRPRDMHPLHVRVGGLHRSMRPRLFAD